MTGGVQQKVSTDTQAMMAFESQKKSVGLAYLLWFFLGLLGIHRFYAGKIVSGAVMLVVWVISLILTLVYIGIVGFVFLWIWWVIDAFLLNGIITRHNTNLMHKLTN